MHLEEIPIEVFIDHILPILPIQDLLHLAQTNKFFSTLCDDETFWQRRIQQDYNFSGAGTARTSGWKFIYRGLYHPRIYVWGEKSKGRLGLEHFPPSVIRGAMPFPVQLKTKEKMVALVAGGMSFHALDSEGNIHVIGTLDGTAGALRMEGFDQPGKTATTPHRLELPAPTRSVSAGRLHTTTLDARGDIWTFLNWGRPFRQTSLAEYLIDTKIKQVESGWTFSAVLTQNGEVIVWWPFGAPLSDKFREQMRNMNAQEKKAIANDNIIQCIPWNLEGRFFAVLPGLPALPPLSSSPVEESEHVKLIQIAGIDNQIVGLTNHGHVLKFNQVADETALLSGRWEYLPKFSETEEIQKHETFSSENGLDAPSSVNITHITGNFINFTAYSTKGSSIVLQGSTDTTPETPPKIMPELQYRDVISVIIGDYHHGALTSNGKLLTWGGYSNGALGLGDPAELPAGSPGGYTTEEERIRARERRPGTPPAVDTPTEVRFDHSRKQRKDRFCFAATAAGWHTGALVIDLEADAPGDEGSDEEPVEETAQPNESPFPGPGQIPGPGQGPPILPPYMRGGLGGIFRVGHAGRGIGRGRGYTLPVMPPHPQGGASGPPA